jgi:ABC-type antimicrobial peptide transport system permease subunit
LQRAIDGVLIRERVMRLGTFYFAGLTTVLVFVGLYAVLNLGVIRRMPEIGLRIALGASARDIRMLVIREALVIVGAGLMAGVPCALASGRLLASSLTLAGPHDAQWFAAAVAPMLLVTVLSVLIPLRRAGRVSPVEALGSH